MAAILNSAIFKSAILDSAILHKTLIETNFNLTQSHSFWFNLMMAAILNSAIFNSAIFDSTILHKTLIETNSILLKLIHSDSTWWWQPSWILPSLILPSWIQPFCTKLWLKLIQSNSNSFILTQHDDHSHLQFCHVWFRHCHLGFRHLIIFSQIHSKTPSLQSDSESN